MNFPLGPQASAMQVVVIVCSLLSHFYDSLNVIFRVCFLYHSSLMHKIKSVVI